MTCRTTLLTAAQQLKAGALPVAADSFLDAAALCSNAGDDEKTDLAWHGVAVALEREARPEVRRACLARTRRCLAVAPPHNVALRRRVARLVESTERTPLDGRVRP